MLKELTLMGFPPMAWYLEASGNINDGSLPVLAPIVKRADPDFFRDFWTKPGYAGSDPSSSAAKDRLQFYGVIRRVHLPGASERRNEGQESRNGVDDAWQKMLTDSGNAWIEMETLPAGDDLYLKGVNITIETGEAKGLQLSLGEMKRDEVTGGGFLTIGMSYGMSDPGSVLTKIEPGDKLSLDNSDYIAIQHYYRHQVPDASFHAWDQFRNDDGTPKYPQRPNVMGYALNGTGRPQDGDIQGKVIVVQSLMDESTCPWSGDWYRRKIAGVKGSEDDFRIYYMQRCMHGNSNDLANNMVVNYMGALYQSLLDMADWLQNGKEPLATTRYEMTDNQVVVEADPSRRGGMQAGIDLTVNGRKCAYVKAGEEFVLRAEAVLPENSGEITGIGFDFRDRRDFPDKVEGLFPVKGSLLPISKDGVKGACAETTGRFDKPGTYFVSARVSSQRSGDRNDIFTQVLNLDRVRVIAE